MAASIAISGVVVNWVLWLYWYERLMSPEDRIKAREYIAVACVVNCIPWFQIASLVGAAAVYVAREAWDRIHDS